MICIDTDLKVGKVPNYHEQKFGKLQISSRKLADYVGQNVRVMAFILVPGEELIMNNFDEKLRIAAIEWKDNK